MSPNRICMALNITAEQHFSYCNTSLQHQFFYGTLNSDKYTGLVCVVLSKITKVVFKNILLFYYGCPNFPLLSFPSQSTPSSHSQSPHCCPCLWVIYTSSLSSPFPLLLPLSPSFLPSGQSDCSIFPCLCFYCAHLFIFVH